jgi:alkyl hydroperoxide reductase subunit D
MKGIKMNIEQIKDSIGDFGKDIKINLGNILSEDGAPGLKLNQIMGIALASAYATKNDNIISAVKELAKDYISENELKAAKSAAAVMGMNNVYYRFIHLVSDKEYSKLPAKLRMNVIGNPGIDKVDFELYSLAISAINGCGMCIDAHVHEIEKAGIEKIGIQSSIRIAAVINATAQSITIN